MTSNFSRITARETCSRAVISLQKNLSRKISRFFVSKISPATGVSLTGKQFCFGDDLFLKIQHWNGAGIDREAAVRESFSTPATLCLQTGLQRTSTSSLLQALDCRSRVSLPYGRLAVDPRTISMLIFSKHSHPRSKIGKRVGGSPKQDLLRGSATRGGQEGLIIDWFWDRFFVLIVSSWRRCKHLWDLGPHWGKSTILVQSALLWSSQPDFQNQSIESINSTLIDPPNCIHRCF